MFKSRPLQVLHHHWHAALLSMVTKHELCCSAIHSLHIVNVIWRCWSQTALLYSWVDFAIVKYATSFDCFGQYFRFLRRKFRVLLDFFVILPTWLLQPRSLLMVTPRYFAWWTSCRTVPQFVKFGHWWTASVDAYDIAFGRIEMHFPFLCPCA